MPVKYIPYLPDTVEGQAILNNITRTRRVLRYRDNGLVYERIKRGMPYYELEKIETVGAENNNMLIRGECLSACAFLKDQGIKVDLVYTDPPFASGADYAKKIFLRRNPKAAEELAKAEEALDLDELRSFEEKMYGDIWNKEDYLNWMYENLQAIKSIMSDTASIYVHLDWHIGHYVKILLDEIFGEDNFQREIIWSLSGVSGYKSLVNNFVRGHDTIYYYSKCEDVIFNKQYLPYNDAQLKRFSVDENGRKFKSITKDKVIYLDNTKGVPLSDVWDDIASFQTIVNSPEIQDYATQKPEAILRRILCASSNEGMVIADFFGGSGVTAKVSHDLNRKFIHVDVGLNSIQTTRDRLISAGANFTIYDVKDGVSLFRNPVQTMDKLKSLIIGMKNEDALDSFWEGSINDSKLGSIPVYIPNLLDHSTKLLDRPLINRVINEAMPDLPDGTKKVIVYYVDIENESDIKKFIAENNVTGIEIELRDLKAILDDVVINDEVIYKMKETKKAFEIEIKSFKSDRLIQKINEYNQKKSLNGSQTSITEENGDNGEEENNYGNGNGNGKKIFVPITISKQGLELIELISLDCTNKDGIWKSDVEIKIDKKGYVIFNGEKTKNFWDAKITSSQKPLRMKIRNIAGDESIIIL